MGLRTVLPSMFHRRLLLLLGASALVLSALAAQLSNLTVVQGRGLLESAESRLVRQRWLPTVRGRILDRAGRVLAQDRPSFSVKFKFEVLSGPDGQSRWVRSEAAAAARRRNRPAWDRLDDEGRGALLARYEVIYRAHLDGMWSRIAEEVGESSDALATRRNTIWEGVARRKRAYVARELTREYRAFFEQRWAEPRGDDRAQTQRREEIDARSRSVGDNYRSGGSARETPGLRASGPEEDPAFLSRTLARLSAERIEEEGRHGAARRGSLAQDGPDAHTLVERISDAQGFALLRLAEDEVGLDVSAADLADPAAAGDRPEFEQVALFPGLVVADARERAYPFDEYTVVLDRSAFPGPLRTDEPLEVTVGGVGCHLIGRMRADIHREDGEGRAARIGADPAFASRVLTADGIDRGRYADGDWVGEAGVEGSMEDSLRGLRGLRIVHLDTGASEQIDPEHGLDVHLTIDAALQARIQAVMSPEAGLAVVQHWQGNQGGDPAEAMPEGTALNGAAVVLDVATGDVLAMVSTPGFSRRDLRERPAWVRLNDLDYPYLNKAIARPYPPGSIAKAVTLCSAAAHGLYSPGERIACTGHFLPDKPDMLRCWVYRPQYGLTTHSARLGHDPDAAEALMVSCNIFFFTLGKRLGAEGIADAYASVGVGRPWGLGVGMEYPGLIGYLGGRVHSDDDAVQMGIGQGPISWTPLHAADALATLARGGVRLRPRVIADREADSLGESAGFDSWAVAAAMDGLWRSVNEHDGTGNHLIIDGRSEPIFNVRGVEVWGKTGTAQANPTRGDTDGKDGPAPTEVRTGDHSWFVVLVGPKGGQPAYSIAVMMEHAGSGGKVSGPIVNQVIHALVREGYLPESPRLGSAASRRPGPVGEGSKARAARGP